MPSLTRAAFTHDYASQEDMRSSSMKRAALCGVLRYTISRPQGPRACANQWISGYGKPIKQQFDCRKTRAAGRKLCPPQLVALPGQMREAACWRKVSGRSSC